MKWLEGRREPPAAGLVPFHVPIPVRAQSYSLLSKPLRGWIGRHSAHAGSGDPSRSLPVPVMANSPTHAPRNTEVDFLVNCFDRNYKRVLTPGFVTGLAESQQYPFKSITVLVNNVADRTDAEERARRLLVEDSRVTRVSFVADNLMRALRATGLREYHLRRAPHYTDYALVAVTLDGPDWLLYWDADVSLTGSADWVSPTLAAMGRDETLVVGNPGFLPEGLPEREALRIDGPYAIGYGFSDQVFLARRSDLARPIYRKIAPASWRYPMANIEQVFEERIDAWMRRTGRLRVTYLPVTYVHADLGRGYYSSPQRRDRVRRRVMGGFVRLASRVSAHPALRAWPHEGDR
jgi:hypothetical protein